ncbi:HET-domain-containing protein, partial [Ascodesmis nigricans]
MQMALEYLQHCENEHDECRRVIMVDPDSTRRRGAIPTRLIDCGRLGSTDNGAGSRIWIVDTSITAVDGVHGSISHNHPYHQYAALSYVWGDPTTNNSQATACSTTTNITDRMTEGLETRLLPATVRDAVKVTQELGVRWLWIDALCILQDSKDDKIRELPKMRAIYRGAIFTIMAASANGSSEGFLGDREPGNDKYDPEIPFLVPYHNNNNEIHNKLKTGTIFLSPVWKQYDESQEPINSRAWCLQERILSPRALIYASHTLQYRCIRETTSIGHAICAPSVTSSGLDLAPLLNLHGGTNLNSPHSIPQLELRHLWNSIVEEYSRRYLTVPGDKLPAIAAVGDSFHYCFTANCYPRYLAGIWHLRDHSSEYSTENLSLIRGLLWFKSYTSRFPRPEVYRAPSWSWAAVDGHVIMENLDDRVREGRCSPGDVEACCDIMECVTVLKHPTVPFGEVEDAVLRVR